MTYKVAVTDQRYLSTFDVLRSRLAEHNITLKVFDKPEPKQLSQYDAIIVQGLTFGRRYIDRLNRTKLVQRLGVGYNELDLPALTSAGIKAANVPDFTPEPVAQHTMGYIVGLANHLYGQRELMVSGNDLVKGQWTIDGRIASAPLWESTLGIVGLGRVGKQVAKRALGSFAKVIAYDPYIDDSVFKAHGVTKVDGLNELLQAARVVTLHTPLFEEPQPIFLDYKHDYKRTGDDYDKTEGMIGTEEIALMQPASFLINASRGEVIERSAVIGALKSEKLAGVGLDVYEEENEPLPLNDELRGMVRERFNLILTPHSGFYTEGIFKKMQELAAEDIIRVLIDETLPHNLVNPEVLEAR